MDRRIKTILMLGAALVATTGQAWVGERTERVNVSSGGAPGNASGANGPNSISWTGRFVAFWSNSSNLVPGDTNGFCDMFVRDRVTGRTERVSRGMGGRQPNANTCYLGDAIPISADGRIVVFSSDASNLVPGDNNLRPDVFAFDRHTGRTERISVSSGGAEAEGGFSFPRDMSEDGRFVLFGSTATNLVAGDTNIYDDLFVRDRWKGTTERVNVSATGVQANGEGFQLASISADGRYVAFGTAADNVVPGVGAYQVYVRDRRFGTTQVVDTRPLLYAVNPSVSATGRCVAFEGYDDVGSDIYVHDRVTRTTRLVTPGLNGEHSNSFSQWPAISASGRYVAFQSDASNLVPGDTNGTSDVFRSDAITGAVTRVSVAKDGAQANNGSEPWSAISADGRHVVFSSEATNLVPDNGGAGAFVRVLDEKR